MRKILIVGAGIIDKPHAAGITVRSIFDGIDPELVAGLVWGEAAAQMKNTKIRLIRLGYGRFSPARIFDNARLKQVSHQIKKAEGGSSPAQSRTKRSGMLRRAVSNLRQWAALIPSRSRVILNSENMEEIRSFAPDVIYTVGETVSSLHLAYKISRALEIPVVIHFMDNWKNSIEWAANPLLHGYQKKLSRYCSLCYTRSTECIAISEIMAEAYERETGVRHCVIMNSVDTEAFYCPPREKDGVSRFVYAGGLHLGRDNALRVIGECIDRVCEKENRSAAFTIYTSEANADLYSGQFESLKNTRFHPPVPHEEIQGIYRDSDVLVHVESNELYSNEFFRFSVSTKISEYLATGRPILFFGPPNIYLFNFLKDNELAYTADSETAAEEAVRLLMTEEENRYSRNAWAYALAHFDLSVARERFRSVIENAALPGGN